MSLETKNSYPEIPAQLLIDYADLIERNEKAEVPLARITELVIASAVAHLMNDAGYPCSYSEELNDNPLSFKAVLASGYAEITHVKYANKRIFTIRAGDGYRLSPDFIKQFTARFSRTNLPGELYFAVDGKLLLGQTPPSPSPHDPLVASEALEIPWYCKLRPGSVVESTNGWKGAFVHKENPPNFSYYFVTMGTGDLISVDGEAFEELCKANGVILTDERSKTVEEWGQAEVHQAVSQASARVRYLNR